MTLDIEQLKSVANKLADEIDVLLDADEPDMEKVAELSTKAEGYEARIKAMIKNQTLKDATKPAPKPEPEPAKGGGIVVTEAEEDKALKARPYKSFGELLMDVKAAAGGNVDDRLRSLRADDGSFSIDGALGGDFVGSLSKAAFLKAPSGLNEGIGSQGGFLVGTDQAGGLLSRVYDVGELLRRVSMMGLSANSNGMTINAEDETSRADGSRRGGIQAYWGAEAGTKVASKPKFRQLELKLKKVFGLVYATDELLQDANALETWIMDKLPEELNFKVEDAIVAGPGGGVPQGILSSGSLIQVPKETGQAATTIVSQNIMKMWSRMWSRSRKNAVWLINQDIEPQLMQLSLGVGTGGTALYVPAGGLSGAPYATIFGKPIIAHESCPTLGQVGDIILADLSQYQMIEKGGIQSASSIHVLFLSDETTYRFVYRCDGESTWASALTPKSGSTNTLSPFVALAVRE